MGEYSQPAKPGTVLDVPVGLEYKPTGTQVFVVGRVPQDGSVWNVIGVFSSLQVAVSECKTEEYFVGPLTMNAALPAEASSWPGAFYPKVENGR